MADTLTNGRVLRIAVPVVLSNATVPILGAVDTGVVGQMGSAIPIGAVGIGAMILTAIYWIFGFLRMGTTGFAAQAIGRGDAAESTTILARALLVGACGGVAIIALQIPLFWAAFQVSPASAEVEALARDYMAIRVWSAPCIIAIYAITGWLVAAERTGAVLLLQLWMNGLNIALDLWFVLGLGWGVEGVAIATLIAETSGAALGLWFCRSAFGTPGWADLSRLLDRAKLKRFLQVNSDILIRSLLLQVIFVSFLFLSSDFGDVPLAATQILMQFMAITAYALDGFAFAVESLVGQALGQRRRASLRQAARLCAIWGMVTGLLLAAVFLIAGGLIIDIMTNADPVRAEARSYLPFMILAPILGVAPFILDGIFIGATRTRDMRNMMAVSTAIYLLSVAVQMPLLGLTGLWLSLLISFVVRGLTLWLRYPALEAEADQPSQPA